MRRREAFTLIELLISVTLLSVVLIFLYKTLADSKRTVIFYKEMGDRIEGKQKARETLFRDLFSSDLNSTAIHNDSANYDTLIMQSNNSLYQRILPYIIYTVRENRLYRVELYSKPEYPIERLREDAIVDELGDVSNFRVYKSEKSGYLIDSRGAKERVAPMHIMHPELQ